MRCFYLFDLFILRSCCCHVVSRKENQETRLLYPTVANSIHQSHNGHGGRQPVDLINFGLTIFSRLWCRFVKAKEKRLLNVDQIFRASEVNARCLFYLILRPIFDLVFSMKAIFSL